MSRNAKNRVEMMDGYVEGVEATDSICLDPGEDICLEDFDFVRGDTVNYPSVKDTNMGGVISFN